MKLVEMDLSCKKEGSDPGNPIEISERRSRLTDLRIIVSCRSQLGTR
jgi:hypothetical protein